MKLPLIHVPISAKVVATLIVTGVLALLRSVGVLETDPQVTAWITVGSGLAAGVIVGEGTKYLQYTVDRLGIPVRIDREL